MNQEDKSLINQLSTNLNGQSVTVDPEANRYIQNVFATNANALYQLTQAVLLQKQAIDRLQQQIDALQHQPQKKGFFGNLFGGQQNPPYSQNYSPRQSTFGQGSFLGSALSTATGVAGGMFLFEGLNHLFSGGSSVGQAPESQASFLGEDFSNQQDADLGFGNGDTFMNDSPSDFGGFDDSSNDWTGGF